MFRKLLKVIVITFLCYLTQVTIASYLTIGGVAPNLALAMLAVVTVCLGRKYVFVMSLWVGYLMELMLPVLDLLQIILYPVAALLGALVFADKTERKLEEEQTAGRKRPQWNPHLRTALCAGLSTSIFEMIHVFYIYLNGVDLESAHIQRAVFCVFYTMAIAFVIQFPIRWWLGIYRLKKAR